MMKAEGQLNCSETAARAGLKMPKSTCSQHYQILREAGLIFSERKGVELSSRLRFPEIEQRFPGLTRSILGAYAAEESAGPR
jgi:DNA-binding transcriptional ArsR family regulator